MICDSDVPCLFFVHANATLPEWTSDCEVPVCDPQAAPHCPNVVCTFVALDAWAPVLHTAYRREGTDQTTHHMRATGRWSIIDFVVVSSSVWVAPSSCHVLLSFDMNHVEADRRPTAITVKVPICNSDRPRSRRKPAYSRQAVHTAVVSPSASAQDRIAAFRAHLLNMPLIPYSTNPTSHAEAIQKHLLDGLCHCFPAEKAKPKVLDEVSHDTYALIRHKSTVHKQATFLGRKFGQSALQFVFVKWAIAACEAGRPIVWQSRGIRAPSTVFGFASKWLAVQWAYATACLHQLRRSIRQQVLAQKTQYVESAAAELQDAAVDMNIGKIYKLLKRFTVKRVPRGQRLVGLDGNMVVTPMLSNASFVIICSVVCGKAYFRCGACMSELSFPYGRERHR